MEVISGPATIGTQFGYYGKKVPKGMFSIVEWGDYSNGGRGYSTVDGRTYLTREKAEEALRVLEAHRA